MLKNFILVLALAPGLAAVVVAQPPGEKNSPVYPTQEELAQRKRLAEILKHPTFLTLRLLSAPPGFPPRERPTETPAPYKVKDWIAFQLLVSQSLFDDVSVSVYRNSYYEVRPVLIREGVIAPYHNRAQRGIERAEFTLPPGSQLKLLPGLEHPLQEIRLHDWYEPLSPGRYELTVRRRFDWQGEWITSAPIYFEVQGRTPTPIPTDVIVELSPQGVQSAKDGSYQISGNIIITVFVRNNSDQPLKVGAADPYYSVRPQLFKDQTLLPYRAETERILTSRDEHPNVAEVPKEFFLDPGTRTGLVTINLADWYNALPPGSYRLTVRQRFEVDGPWTAESAPLLFQIAPGRRP